MGSYFLKAQPQMQRTGASFCLLLWSNNRLRTKLYYLLIFPLALMRSNSSHCQLMELFKDKESIKEKVDSGSNWKAAWSRMILEWHLITLLKLFKALELFFQILEKNLCTANEHREPNYCYKFYSVTSRVVNARVKYLKIWHRLLDIDVSQSIFWIA